MSELFSQRGPGFILLIVSLPTWKRSLLIWQFNPIYSFFVSYWYCCLRKSASVWLELFLFLLSLITEFILSLLQALSSLQVYFYFYWGFIPFSCECSSLNMSGDRVSINAGNLFQVLQFKWALRTLFEKAGEIETKFSTLNVQKACFAKGREIESKCFKVNVPRECAWQKCRKIDFKCSKRNVRKGISLCKLFFNPTLPGEATCPPVLFSFVTEERLTLGSWNFAILTLYVCSKNWHLICFSKINTITMATVLFQVTENCKNRENAITHCLFSWICFKFCTMA